MKLYKLSTEVIHRVGNVVQPVDNYLDTPSFKRKVIHMLAHLLTRLVRSIPSGRAARRIARTGGLVLLPVLCINLAAITTSVAGNTKSSKDISNYKTYALLRVVDTKQSKCFQQIIHKESRWNPKARNGSHYGLGQMRSKWYKTINPYHQINETIRYITHRYGNPCNAWAFHIRKGYY